MTRARGILVSLLALVALSGCSSTVDDPLGIPRTPDYVDRGKTLVKGLAACGFCHGERPSPSAILSGGLVQHDRYGEVTAPNITPSKSGIGSWTARHLIKALRGHVTPDERKLSIEVHKGYEWMSDEDLLAIVSYLHSVPPVEHSVDRRTVGFMKRNTTGFFESRKEVRGHVPKIDRRFAAAYGSYLVDHVARCAPCHNSPASMFQGEGYLEGGKTVQNQFGKKVAPNITGSQTQGIGSWSQEAIVRYLKTGTTQSGERVDPRFCPVEFYANADESELHDIARYLKTVPG